MKALLLATIEMRKQAIVLQEARNEKVRELIRGRRLTK